MTWPLFTRLFHTLPGPSISPKGRLGACVFTRSIHKGQIWLVGQTVGQMLHEALVRGELSTRATPNAGFISWSPGLPRQTIDMTCDMT